MNTEIQVLLTGAGSGIGRALAIRLVKNYGAKIIAIGRREQALLSLKNEFPNHINPIAADICKSTDRQKIIDVVKQSSPLTHVINNAGIIEPITSIENMNIENYRYQFAVNAEAPLFLTLALIPFLAKGARVLFTTSGAAFRAEKGLGSYCISKAALEMTYLVLKQEFSEAPIYFASLRPGGVDTRMAEIVGKASSEICPMSDTVKKGKKTLLKPEIPANFMEWVLLYSETACYEKHWDINEPNLENWEKDYNRCFQEGIEDFSTLIS